MCHDLEAGEPQVAGATQHGPVRAALPAEVANGSFAAVVVVNYLHRPLLGSLLGLLEGPGAVLIYEGWAEGNEAFAAPKDAAALANLLRPNELLSGVLPQCEVLSFSHGRLEEYEGRDCSKQLLCARLPDCYDGRGGGSGSGSGAGSGSGSGADAGLAALKRLLTAGAESAELLAGPIFGREWLHARAAAPALDFCVGELLRLLRGYDPADSRAVHLERMSERDKWGQHYWGHCYFMFFDRDFLDIPVNLLLSSRKCQGVPIFPIRQN